MKKIFILKAILPVMLGIFALQSCTKEDDTTFKVYASFSEPKVVAPLSPSLVKPTGTTVDLKWTSTDNDGDSPLADVYFGTEESPALYKAAHNAMTLNVPVVEGQTYYWHVIMKDANGVTTGSPTWSFSVAVKYDINNFVGVFDCNEPGYGHYNCNITKVNSTTVRNDNFWDSGWAVDYVFDDYGNVTIVPVSYSGYDITGSGKFDNTAKTFYTDYVVIKHSTGAVVDENTHTFVKK